MSYPGEVPNAPIREAFEESGLNAATVCRRLGWVSSSGQPDTSRLQRRLGLRAGMKGGHGPARQSQATWAAVRYETAIAIVRAIDRDPVDFGL